MAAGSGGDQSEERDADGEERDRAASRRDVHGDDRDLAGAARDVDGAARDAIGQRRDIAADERDREAEARDRATLAKGYRPVDHSSEVARAHAASDRSHAAHDRHAGARDRSSSERDRTTSLADRNAGHAERVGSELDRVEGSTDRGAAAEERASAALDHLTGARSRGSGLTELTREMARAERTSQPLTLMYADVDYMKTINDSFGHAAGDDALVAVVDAIRGALRSYDLIVRVGGDEFICVLAGLDEASTHARVAAITATLAADPELPSATFGIAEMLAGETPAELVARADADLYARRRKKRGEHGPTLTERPDAPKGSAVSDSDCGGVEFDPQFLGDRVVEEVDVGVDLGRRPCSG